MKSKLLITSINGWFLAFKDKDFDLIVRDYFNAGGTKVIADTEGKVIAFEMVNPHTNGYHWVSADTAQPIEIDENGLLKA